MKKPNAEAAEQIALLCNAPGLNTEHIVNGVIGATNFTQLVECAENGDIHAAKELISLATAYLVSDVFGPMPDALRRHLVRSFSQVRLGKSADIALHLKKPKGGRPGRSHQMKLRLGQLMRKKMQQRGTLEDASFELSMEIAEGIKQNGSFYEFTQAPDSKTLEGIYNEVKSELKGIFQQVEVREGNL